MRLLRKGISIDVEQTAKMAELFSEAGFTCFDTAFVYPGSEKAIRKALVERHPGDSCTIATKLMATAGRDPQSLSGSGVCTAADQSFLYERFQTAG